MADQKVSQMVLKRFSRVPLPIGSHQVDPAGFVLVDVAEPATGGFRRAERADRRYARDWWLRLVVSLRLGWEVREQVVVVADAATPHRTWKRRPAAMTLKQQGPPGLARPRRGPGQPRWAQL